MSPLPWESLSLGRPPRELWLAALGSEDPGGPPSPGVWVVHLHVILSEPVCHCFLRANAPSLFFYLDRFSEISLVPVRMAASASVLHCPTVFCPSCRSPLPSGQTEVTMCPSALAYFSAVKKCPGFYFSPLVGKSQFSDPILFCHLRLEILW